MKRIFVVAVMRNDSDIVESFCRHALTYCNGVLLFDDASADNSREIAHQLAMESLPVYLYETSSRPVGSFDEAVIYELVKKAVEEFAADLVIPLKTSQFLLSRNKRETRDALESLSVNAVYHIDCRVHVPCIPYNDFHDQIFLPCYFSLGCVPELDAYGASVIGGALHKKPAILSHTGHYLAYPFGYESVLFSDLLVADLPVRSLGQLKIQTIIWWLNDISSPQRTELLPKNPLRQLLYDFILQETDYSLEGLQQIAIDCARVYKRLAEKTAPKSVSVVDIVIKAIVPTNASKSFMRPPQSEDMSSAWLDSKKCALTDRMIPLHLAGQVQNSPIGTPFFLSYTKHGKSYDAIFRFLLPKMDEILKHYMQTSDLG